MLRIIIKIFVRSFYLSNTGFFLFFFFFFFGVVSPGSLITYHYSLITSILTSQVTMMFVMGLWILYYLKGLRSCLDRINSETGVFLYKFQLLPLLQQIGLLLMVQILIYAPIIFYQVAVVYVAGLNDYTGSLWTIVCYQLLVFILSTSVILTRLNSLKRNNTFQFDVRKTWKPPFIFLVFLYFFYEKKFLWIGLKIFCLALLYVILVLNKIGLTYDEFILFYVIILFVHSTIPLLAINFLESKVKFHRTLPMNFITVASLYLLGYALLILPEMLYLLFHKLEEVSFLSIVGHYLLSVVTLFLMTAVRIGKSMNMKAYVKFVFVLFIVSVFALHTTVLWQWMFVELAVAIILFYDGYYQYEENP